jgi:hypothetical protein
VRLDHTAQAEIKDLLVRRAMVRATPPPPNRRARF